MMLILKLSLNIDESFSDSSVSWVEDINPFDAYAGLIATSITRNECWNVYADIMPKQYHNVFLVVDKRNMDSLTERVGYIKVEYLGTLSLPQSIIYDKPYVWIMVEKDERIQMLKLLPNN